MSAQNRWYQVSKCLFVTALLLAASPAALAQGPGGHGGVQVTGFPVSNPAPPDMGVIRQPTTPTTAQADGDLIGPNAPDSSCWPNPLPAGWWEYQASQIVFYSRVFATPYEYCREGVLTLNHEVTIHRNVTVPEIVVPDQPELYEPAFQKDIPEIGEVISGTRVRDDGNEDFVLQVLDYFPAAHTPGELSPELLAANFADGLLCARVGGPVGVTDVYGYVMSLDTSGGRSTAFMPINLMSEALSDAIQTHGYILSSWRGSRNWQFTWCGNAEGDAQYQACARGCNRSLDQQLDAAANNLTTCLAGVGIVTGVCAVLCLTPPTIASIPCLIKTGIGGPLCAARCGKPTRATRATRGTSAARTAAMRRVPATPRFAACPMEWVVCGVLIREQLCESVPDCHSRWCAAAWRGSDSVHGRYARYKGAHRHGQRRFPHADAGMAMVRDGRRVPSLGAS
jgi:hypothetical protein